MVPVVSFRPAGWTQSKADLHRISFVQVTAFQSGPYDGKMIQLDGFITSAGSPDSGEAETHTRILPVPIEPNIVKRGAAVRLLEGNSLAGWIPTPRVYVPETEIFASIPSEQLFDAVIEHYSKSSGELWGVPHKIRVKSTGVWTLENGTLTGEQIPDTILGAYLVSEKKYGDFELAMEINPDYPIDTGVMVRAHRIGSVGFQVLIDNRPNGTIGGVYGNSVGHFFAYPFVFRGDELPGNKIANIRTGDPDAMKFRGGQWKTGFAATLDEFKEVWKVNDWNKLRIRCTGRLPLIETWVNGVAIAKIDTATLGDHVPNFDREEIFKLIGRKGHIAFEVHDSPTRDRWAPGAKARWRNIRIRELEIQE